MFLNLTTWQYTELVMQHGFCVSGDEVSKHPSTEQTYILVYGVSDESSLTGRRPEQTQHSYSVSCLAECCC